MELNKKGILGMGFNIFKKKRLFSIPTNFFPDGTYLYNKRAKLNKKAEKINDQLSHFCVSCRIGFASNSI